jgi:hypothetical protein
MATLLAGHYYKNRYPKRSQFVNEIMPMRDIEVSQAMLDSFEDITDTTVYIKDETFALNRKRAIDEGIINAI